jgi:hypothetical protein
MLLITKLYKYFSCTITTMLLISYNVINNSCYSTMFMLFLMLHILTSN